MRFEKVKTEKARVAPPVVIQPAATALPKINLQAIETKEPKDKQDVLKKESKSMLAKLRTNLRSNIDRSNKSILSAVGRRAELQQRQQEKEAEKSEREDEEEQKQSDDENGLNNSLIESDGDFAHENAQD